MNGDDAAKLKNHWSALVNWHELWTTFGDAFKSEEMSYITVNTVETCPEDCQEQINGWYEKTRDKVCEIMILRSMARPVPQNSTRKDLVEKAVETMVALKGTISPRLTFLVLKIAPQAFPPGEEAD